MSTFILWFLLGSACTFVFTAGVHFAYFQREFPSLAKGQIGKDINHAFLFAVYASLASWLGIIIVFILSSYLKHGWKFPTTKGAT